MAAKSGIQILSKLTLERPSLRFQLRTRESKCNCKEGHVFEMRVQKALVQIDENAITSTCSAFSQAISTYQSGFSTKQLSGKVFQQAQKLFVTMSKAPLDESVAVSVAPFWDILANMSNYSNITQIDTIMTCRRVMMLFHELHVWLADIIDAARNFNSLESTDSVPPWVVTLWHRIDTLTLTHGSQGRRNKEATPPIHLNSISFLPTLQPPVVYEFKCPLRISLENKEELVAEKVIDAIRTFLRFPTGPHAIFQQDLLDAIYKTDSTLLYLRPIWDMFTLPDQVVWQRCKKAQIGSTVHARRSVDCFVEELNKHAILDISTSESEAFEDLAHLTQDWIHLSKPRTSPDEIQVSDFSPVSFDDAATEIIDFLDTLYPLVEHSLASCRNSPNMLLAAAAKRLDFYSPFRQLAPTIAHAMTTLYSNTTRLTTNVGLVNAVCFRGLFYGSQWARNHLTWFDSIEDWTSYYSAFSRIPKGANKERYFISVNPYGTPNSRRSTNWVEDNFQVMRQLQEDEKDWTTFLATFNQDYLSLFKYLLQFKGIGPLTALLLIGDLVAAQVVAEPSVNQWSHLIFRVSKGGIRGLRKLSLIPYTGTVEGLEESQVVQDAFDGLHSAIANKWDVVKQEKVGYNLIMLEHALCKYSRMVKT
ncbi:hypothetical protein BDN72DRAFT_906932 [Pluteus cervinus]|uniref:Uncharacterized protein n=1 Tax=Pluteus cervinus TaxID=181527 RepID=A0ACD2ZXV7_9AGAR|nr:hypothetical protein BDN72DRAFT_906932 [Pluteus cervinus]